MAAEGMLDALDTDEALQDLFAETKDKTLIEKIKNWLSDMAKSIRAAIDSLAWNHPEVRALKDQADYMQGVSDRLKAALDQAAENYRASQRGLYADAAADPDVQAYTEAIKEKGITLEDARAEADALAAKLFARAEKNWIEQHMDLYEEGFEKAKAAMMEYAQGKTSMVKAFTDQGLFAPPQELFPALAYAGRQMAAFQNARAGENGTRLQIRADEQGPYVDVDVDQEQFDGLTMPEMQIKASEILRERYVGKTIRFQNGVATMYGRDPDHYAYSKFPKNTKKRETKMRASAEFDNVLGISSYLRSEPTNEKHPEMINWDYYKTRFKFGNSPIYDFEIKVGNRTDGTTEIYDVYPWYEKGSTSNSGPTTNVARGPQTFENASENSVTLPENNVNGKLYLRSGKATLPPLNIDPAYAFKYEDAAADEAEQQIENRKDEIQNIIQQNGMMGLQIQKPDGRVEILTPSVRKGVKWQLTYLGSDGEPTMHENYGQTSDDHVQEAIHTEDELLTHFANMTMQAPLTMETLTDEPEQKSGGVQFSQRANTEDRQDRQALEDLQADADFYAQAMTDEETAEAVRLFAKIYRNLESLSNDLVGKITEREDWKYRGAKGTVLCVERKDDSIPSNRDNEFLVIIRNQLIMGQKRKVLYLCLRKQQPVKRIVMRFAIGGPGQCAYRENMLICQGQRNESRFLTALGKIFFTKGNAFRSPGVFEHYLPHGNDAIIDGIVRIKNHFSCFS